MTESAWHIPKRSNLLQAVGSLVIIKELDLHNKKWSGNNAKRYNQSLGTWGLTDKGKSLSNTARETLEALLKYLGLIRIDSKNILQITSAGYKLIDEFDNFKKPDSKLKLSQSEAIYNFQTSNTIKNQLIKLIISNPTIPERNLAKDVCLNPFIETLRYLVDEDIHGVSREEMAMFIFFQKNPSEYETIKKRILSFRKLTDVERTSVVTEFNNSYIGNKVLGESSATVKYWGGLTKISGLLDTKESGFFPASDQIETIKSIIKDYEYPQTTIFDSESLWWAYFGTDEIKRLPRTVTYSIGSANQLDHVIRYRPLSIISDEYCDPIINISGTESFQIKMFTESDYEVKVFTISENSDDNSEISTTERVEYEKDKLFLSKSLALSFEAKKTEKIDYQKELLLMIEDNEITPRYSNYLINMLILTGMAASDSEAKKYIKKGKASIKGGYFEKLFYELLLERKEKKVIDEVIAWRGRISGGIYYPSPAGSGSETDMEFKVGMFHVGLELTTASGRSQWKTEAESVTDHINKLRKRLDDHNVIGVFSSPSITEFMKAICFYFSEYIYKIPIIPIKSKDLAEILISSTNSNEIIDKLNSHFKTMFGKEIK